MRKRHTYRSLSSQKQNSPHLILKIIGVVFLFVIIQGYYYNYLVESNQTFIDYEISEGQSINQIAKDLKAKNIIQSTFLFKRHLKKENIDQSIKTGVFQVPTQVNIPDLSYILTQSPIASSKVTIIEGEKISDIQKKYNLNDINNCLEDCGLEEFFELYNIPTPKTLEGFLFPDTYFISETNNYKNLVQKATTNFTKKLSNLDIKSLEHLPINNFYEVLIVASLIEKEVILEEDKALVSGIIYKRLENNWTLGIDAALLYEKDNNKITSQDLQSNSVYNLRKIQGLPPTPICNPSLSSIQAALNPKTSKYWFYLTKPITNEVVYSVSNEEHNLNKAKYLY